MIKHLSFCLCLMAILASSAQAQSLTIDNLARDVDRAEAIRAVKNLQRMYAQYSQFALWHEMADLFADDGALTFDKDEIKGRNEIDAYLSSHYGAGHYGLKPGDVHTILVEMPLINLSRDGKSAKGRWHGFFFKGGRDSASFEGGIYENTYVKQGSVWKIASLHFYPQYVGDYETGWTNWKGGELPIIPYHFTVDETGVPIPAPVGPAPHVTASLASLEQRINALRDENEVRNLQSAYGYYVDRKMWDDVADLFATKSVLEIDGVGIYDGPKGVRRAMKRMGPADLQHGELNDHPQFDTVVTIAPGGHEAHARGTTIGMLGEAGKGTAYWEISVFDNRFIKENGIWKFREMRIFPLMKTDYHLGWAKSRITDSVPGGSLAPDRPVPHQDEGEEGSLMPAFISAHPVTGRAVGATEGIKLVASSPLTGSIDEPSSEKIVSLKQAVRRLAVAKAYDGVENVSTAYGEYLDDFQWQQLGKIFGSMGEKQDPFAGYYFGAANIAHSDFIEWGNPPAHRFGISFHWRIQPVINIASDGRSANLRTRLWHPRTSNRKSARGNFNSSGFSSGMYPNDQAYLENGIWRLWSVSIDEPYFTSPDWHDGWSAAKEPSPGFKPRPSPLMDKFPPKIPLTVLGERENHFQGGTGEPIYWPGILPMWFNYKNPVSGRVPDHFWPDCVTCEYAPETSMTRHGYLPPPTGPEPDTDSN